MSDSNMEKGLAIIMDALTAQYLRPALIAAGMPEEEAQQYVVEYSIEQNITIGHAREEKCSDDE